MEIKSMSPTKVIVSTDLLTVASIFTPIHKGRLFTILRHPVERALAHYQKNNDEPKISKEVSETQYPHLPDNHLIKTICNLQDEIEINESHLETAKSILRRKCILGLYHKMDESLDRLERFFRWKDIKNQISFEDQNEETLQDDHNRFNLNNDQMLICHEQILEAHEACMNRYNSDTESKNQNHSVFWKKLLQLNRWDMMLYNYATDVIWNEQGLVDYRTRRNQPRRHNDNFIIGN